MPSNDEDFLRQILDCEQAFTLRMAGFIPIKQDWMIAERSIQDHLFYFLPQGRIHCQLNGSSFILHGQNVLWVHAHTQQAFHLAAGEKNSVIYYLRFHSAADYPRNMHQLIPCHQQLLQTWDQINMLAAAQGAFIEEKQRCAIAHFMMHIFESAQTHKHARDGLRPQQQERVINFIQQHIDQRFNIGVLAQLLDMNNDYFARQFKKSFHKTPQTYIKQERIRQACALLSESDYQVQEVAEMLGYEDPYFFSRQFKSVMKLSPQHWQATQG